VVVQRSIAQVFLVLQAALTAFLAVLLGVQRNPHALAVAVAAVVYLVCWVAFRRGWEPARYVLVAVLTLIVVVGTREPYLTGRPMMGVIIPPVVALMLTSADWIIGSAVLGVLGLGLRSRFQTPLLEPLDLLLLIMTVSGLVLARRSVDSAMSRLTGQANAAQVARELAEGAARDALAERDRATKLEAQVVHLQRLESVGRLAGGVAHDFNNLLTVIGASTSMAERAIASGACPKADLEEVREAVARASGLTKQLFAFARKQVLSKRGVDLNELVYGIERVLRRVIGDDTVLSVKLGAEPLRALADSAQLEQVIVNLVINARDAITPGGLIEIATQRVSFDEIQHEPEGLARGDYACVEVRDNGAGMTSEVQKHLFEPFFTTKPPGRGTGLGLSTCFGIVRQHDGTIQVESEPGRGTIMRVLVPLLANAAPQLMNSGVVELAKQRPRVLLAEDEPQVRAVAARSLSAAGFEVLQAANGALGLALFKSQHEPFDVLVTDVLMPELSGPELARAVRQLDPNLGLVFMSGYPEAMQSASADDFAGAAFLAKPFAPQELVDAVRERVAQRRAELRDHG
jgi:signal transduction histidine kinase/ActR/RegA family two-component response regulator